MLTNLNNLGLAPVWINESIGLVILCIAHQNTILWRYQFGQISEAFGPY